MTQTCFSKCKLAHENVDNNSHGNLPTGVAADTVVVEPEWHMRRKNSETFFTHVSVLHHIFHLKNS